MRTLIKKALGTMMTFLRISIALYSRGIEMKNCSINMEKDTLLMES